MIVTIEKPSLVLNRALMTKKVAKNQIDWISGVHVTDLSHKFAILVTVWTLLPLRIRHTKRTMTKPTNTQVIAKAAALACLSTTIAHAG
ncbi:MAG: hypothetical protein ACO3RV_08035, partial [Luteolibacter sp.]